MNKKCIYVNALKCNVQAVDVMCLHRVYSVFVSSVEMYEGFPDPEGMKGRDRIEESDLLLSKEEKVSKACIVYVVNPKTGVIVLLWIW